MFSASCHIFGHDKVQPAAGLRGRCYRMSGRKAVPISTVKTEGPVAKFTKLGDGTCRGDNWQKAPWPLDKGRRSEKECYAACLAAAGCTAFETSKPSQFDILQARNFDLEYQLIKFANRQKWHQDPMLPLWPCPCSTCIRSRRHLL